MRGLRFKQKYFRMIIAGEKDLECRVNYPFVQKIKEGDIIKCFWKNEECWVKIKEIRHYKNFDEMLNNEDINRLIPGLNFYKARQEYKKIYPNWKVRKFGIVVFEFVKIIDE